MTRLLFLVLAALVFVVLWRGLARQNQLPFFPFLFRALSKRCGADRLRSAPISRVRVHTRPFVIPSALLANLFSVFGVALLRHASGVNASCDANAMRNEITRADPSSKQMYNL